MATLNQNAFRVIKDKDEDLKKIRTVGFELEFGIRDNNTQGDMFNELRIDNSLFAGIGHDGGGIEVMTHPITITKLFDQSGYLDKCIKYILKKNATPIVTAGVHVNISKLPTDDEHTYQHILWIYIIFNEQIQKIMGRRSNWARSPFEMIRTTKEKIPALIAQNLMDLSIGGLGNNDIYTISQTNNKAYAVTDKKNRYEFRGCKSSVYLNELYAWAQFCNNMLEIAAKDSLKGVCFSDLLVGEYINSYLYDTVQTCRERHLSEAEIYKPMNKVKYVSTKEKDSKTF